ncbi:MAG: hypothetical protein ACO1QR_15885 [Chthoniobacteraceae bacterium]
MSNTRDTNVVSIWFWLLAFVVMAIPLVNIVMMFVWAFAGENQSRKNYFRALIVIFVLAIGLAIALAVLGMLPGVVDGLTY